MVRPRPLLLAALAVGLFAVPAPAQDAPKSDAVYLLDVSGSMRRDRALDRAQDLLTGLLDKVVQPGTQVAFIPFGSGVHPVVRFEVPEDEAGARARVEEMRRTIRRAEARDSYTYLFEAIHKGLEVLHQFRERRPDHSRHLVLVSDGHQVVRRGESAPTLDAVLAHWEKQGFKGSEEWFLWYAYIGEPDPHLTRALARTGAGQAIPLDRLSSMQWSFTRLDQTVLELGARPRGTWTHRARLALETDAAGAGRRLLLRMAGEPAPGTMLDVSPREITLEAGRQEVDVEISCAGAPAGVFEGALALGVEGGALHWVEPRRLRLSFHVALPKIVVEETTLDLGRIVPGSAAEGRIVFAPDEDAMRAAPVLRLVVARAPEGVTVDVPSTIRVKGKGAVPVTVKVPPGAPEGDGEVRLRCEPAEGVELEGREIVLRYRTGFGHVAVTGELLFEEVRAGGNTRAAVTLTPDAETARLKPKIAVGVGEGLPREVKVQAPRSLVLDGPTVLSVELRVPEGTKGGAYEAKLWLAAPEGVKVEPQELPLVVTVTEPAPLVVPPSVDLGDVGRARKLNVRLPLAGAADHAGAVLAFVAQDGTAVEPGTVTLAEDTRELAVKLSPPAGGGDRTASLKVFLEEAGGRREVGAVTIRWRAHESFLRLAGLSGPRSLAAGSGEGVARLEVEASPDLAGRLIRISPAVPGLAVKVAAPEVALEGGWQSIRVLLRAEGARAGRYEGALKVALAEPIEGLAELEPVALTLEVEAAAAPPPAPEPGPEVQPEPETQPVVAEPAPVKPPPAKPARPARKPQPPEEGDSALWAGIAFAVIAFVALAAFVFGRRRPTLKFVPPPARRPPPPRHEPEPAPAPAAEEEGENDGLLLLERLAEEDGK